jgi:hypothetical protein
MSEVNEVRKAVSLRRVGKRTVIGMLILGTVAAACDSTAPGNAHVGTYALVTINGAPLPQNHSVDGSTQVVGGAVTLEGNGHFRDSTELLIVANGTELSLVGAGAYQRNGDVITFVPFAGDHDYAMTFSSADLTLTQEVSPGRVYVYKRIVEGLAAEIAARRGLAD